MASVGDDLSKTKMVFEICLKRYIMHISIYISLNLQNLYP